MARSSTRPDREARSNDVPGVKAMKFTRLACRSGNSFGSRVTRLARASFTSSRTFNRFRFCRAMAPFEQT